MENLQKARWRQEKRKLLAKMAHKEAKERARKRKQGGEVVPLVMSLSKCHKFKIIMDDKDDEVETPQPLIPIQLGN